MSEALLALLAARRQRTVSTTVEKGQQTADITMSIVESSVEGQSTNAIMCMFYVYYYVSTTPTFIKVTSSARRYSYYIDIGRQTRDPKRILYCM